MKNPSLYIGGLLTLGLALACEDPAPSSGPKERSQAVLASGQKSSPEPRLVAAEPKAAEPSARKKALCSGTKESELPRKSLSGLGSSALPFSGGELPKGTLVWVNLWAAWCEPCKKELPILHKFRKDLKAEGISIELAFVSVDDDERQLKKLLDAPGSDGIKRTFWLTEGAEREAFLKRARDAQ